MAPQIRWRSPQGRRTVAKIVQKEIPQWPNGLYPEQEDVVTRVLDGEDVFCCLTTGGGKSAMFAVPIIVLREMARNPDSYPNLPIRALPIGLVINSDQGISRKHTEIQECKTWNIICVDPEHLRDKAWRQITDFDTFRTNITFGCVDEAHLIDEWGAAFSALLFDTSVNSSAVVFPPLPPFSPSLPQVSPASRPTQICKSLGMSGDDFYLLQCSNERPNTQFIMEPLDHGLGGKEFPSLLRYLNSGRKAVVHVRRIDEVFRVFMYLFNSLPEGMDRLRRIKMYHSLRSFEANEEILRLLDEDPRCQVVIATIAIANGINIRSLLDSITLGFPESVNQAWQEKGRVGRDPNTIARGVILFQRSAQSDARKQLAVLQPLESPPAVPHINPQTGKSKRKKTVKPMEHNKALMLVEEHCYIALWSTIYQNPPLELSTRDCIIAKRRFPCSLCQARAKMKLTFPPSPLPPGLVLPPFHPPTTNQSPPLSADQKKLKLKKKERAEAETTLTVFGDNVRLTERKRSINQRRPRSSFFPSTILKLVLDNLLSIKSLDDLTNHVESWAFVSEHVASLHSAIVKLQRRFEAAREEARLAKNAKQRATRRRWSKKAKHEWDSDEESGEEEEEEEEVEPEPEADAEADDESSADEVNHHPPSSPVPPPAKRAKTALAEVTNRSRPMKKKPEKQETAAAVAATFRPAYKTSRRRAAGQ
ncbi:hypothetical protein C8F04DRAFT_1244800 [Mycena alexandri]|uniref:DNA 3'-5' helicase n=1 Tax=Mycena alexandri TaxID=1745969 RepID=A0AAD6RX97_9AGAR|nr:hypothetical protein C8F04DRAFT_1244800 [Mycena alexandri]